MKYIFLKLFFPQPMLSLKVIAIEGVGKKATESVE